MALYRRHSPQPCSASAQLSRLVTLTITLALTLTLVSHLARHPYLAGYVHDDEAVLNEFLVYTAPLRLAQKRNAAALNAELGTEGGGGGDKVGWNLFKVIKNSATSTFLYRDNPKRTTPSTPPKNVVTIVMSSWRDRRVIPGFRARSRRVSMLSAAAVRTST